ncbi:DUF2062 domain-containing protein [Oricola thermophila]|uniref:DUF2062 domain-containing protein n=1 Tax=Oricola thermophila TaxID=2742145 RepID=A0A6N1VFV1_9HYPH|nr:DUF2062 domain-containing protein [Oricola thermophila]QKV18485.1 DUF2062 domain-containing protein [Oricola thermophila]
MIFARRNQESWHQRLRVFFLPRRNYSRSFRYYWKRMLRIKATPHAIAAGVAAGAFASFTPFMGLHFILAFVLAWLLAGNMIAAAFGTAIGNPITFPAIWAATHGAGSAILGATVPGGGDPAPVRLGSMLSHGEISALWEPILKPMLVGGIPLGLVVALVLYLLTRFAVAAFQRRRQMHFETRRPATQNPEIGL